ncbi:MAG: lysophospholipase [Proteobacteria bacterium]|nr:lysophospholipase [Pseudomonadota bacterium]
MNARADSTPPSVRRVEMRFTGSGRASLFRRAWIAPQPERALALVHGFAEHSARYEHLGTWFARRGFAVHAYDQRGHGQSPGLRGHVDRFDEFLDDLAAFLDEVRRESPGIPCTLVGHSMGGLVVATFARERNPDVAGVVLSGAVLKLPPDLSRGKIALARLLRRVVPRLTTGAGIDPHAISRDPEVVRRYVEDPLVFTRMTLSFAAEMLSAVERCSAGGADVSVPVQLLHGAEDLLCLPAGSRDFFETLDVPGSDLRIYPGLRHEIFNEPEQEQVFEDILEWTLAREAEAVEAR